MPTVLQDGPYSFIFFSSDRDEPYHIHVKRDRHIAKFWLNPISLAKNRGFVVVNVTITDEKLTVELDNGGSIVVPLEWYPRLVHASPKERNNWQLLGDGYAIEWPDLDEHIGIEGLLAGRRSGESKKSFERWLASRQNATRA